MTVGGATGASADCARPDQLTPGGDLAEVRPLSAASESPPPAP